MTPGLRTYFWDFFGARAVPTARHFKRHLEQFLQQHGAGELMVVEEPDTALHHAVGVRAPEQHYQLIERALRPKRYVEQGGTR